MTQPSESSSSPQSAVLAALTRIEQRLGAMEGRLGGLEDRLDKLSPGDDRGPDELRQELARTEASLGEVEQRVADVDRQVAELATSLSGVEHTVGGLVRDGEGVLATATDTMDSIIARLDQRGIDVDQRIRAALGLVESLSEPATIESLNEGLAILRSIPGTVAMVADTFDGVVRQLGENGIDVDDRVRVVCGVMERVTAPEALALVRDFLAHVDAIHRLLESGIFAEGAVEMVDRAAGALAAMESGRVKRVGAFGALRALWDPAVQQSLGVLVEFGRRFGSNHPGARGGSGDTP